MDDKRVGNTARFIDEEFDRNLAVEADAKDPVELAERLFVVLEGAYITSALEGDRGVLDHSRAFFVELVEAAVRDRP